MNEQRLVQVIQKSNLRNAVASDVVEGAGRVAALDALRGVGIVAVVALHVTTPFVFGAYLEGNPAKAADGGLAATLVASLHLLTGFGVPLFVALSAAGLALRQHQPMTRPADYAALLARRARAILPAYVFWSIASAAPAHPERLWPPPVLLQTLLNGTADTQFYFIPLLLEIYILWPLLQFGALLAGRSITMACVVGTTGAATSVAFWGLPALAGGASTVALLPMFFVYVALGLAAAPHLGAMRRAATRTPVLVACGAVTIGALLMTCQGFQALAADGYTEFSVRMGMMILRPQPMIYASGAIAVCTLLALRFEATSPGRALAWVGRYAFAIYLTHVLVLRLWGQDLAIPAPVEPGEMRWMVRMSALGLLTLVSSLALAVVGDRIPVLRVVLGSRR